jgi:hypothetical protein
MYIRDVLDHDLSIRPESGRAADMQIIIFIIIIIIIIIIITSLKLSIWTIKTICCELHWFQSQ